jgi:hypothetical protein
MLVFVDGVRVDERSEHGAEDRLAMLLAEDGSRFRFADTRNPSLARPGKRLKCFASFQVSLWNRSEVWTLGFRQLPSGSLGAKARFLPQSTCRTLRGSGQA